MTNNPTCLALGCFGAIILIAFSLVLIGFAPSYFIGNKTQYTGNTSDATSTLMGESCAVPEPYKTIFNNAGRSHGAPASLLAAVFAKEQGIKSPGDWKLVNSAGPWKTSSADAKGPFQYKDGTWNAYAVDGNNDGKKDVQNIYDAAATASNHFTKNIQAHKSRGQEGAIKAAIELFGDQTTQYLTDVYNHYQALESCSSPSMGVGTITDCGFKILQNAPTYRGIPYSQPLRAKCNTNKLQGVSYLDCSSYANKVYIDAGLLRPSASCFTTHAMYSHKGLKNITKQVRNGELKLEPGDLIRTGYLGENTRTPLAHVVIYASGNINSKKIQVWQSGGNCKNQRVCYGPRNTRFGEQYFRAVACAK